MQGWWVCYTNETMKRWRTVAPLWLMLGQIWRGKTYWICAHSTRGLSNWGNRLWNVLQVVTSNASNDIRAKKLLLEKRPNMFRSSCLTHTQLTRCYKEPTTFQDSRRYLTKPKDSSSLRSWPRRGDSNYWAKSLLGLGPCKCGHDKVARTDRAT
jgi:hypothetical protein